MKRDKDLMRQLLLQAERKLEQGEPGFSPTPIPGTASAEILNHHVRLLGAGGLVEVTEESLGESQTRITGLTRQAHEFLEVVRDETRWNQAERTLSEKGLTLDDLPFDVLKDFLFHLKTQGVSS